MRIIEQLSDKIAKEIDCAEEYAKCALMYKDERPLLAEVYYRIANEKISHMNLLHDQVISIIDEYRKEKGDPPEAMQLLYDILHRKHIDHVAAVKGMLSLYKES